jgi:hypothetical protein
MEFPPVDHRIETRSGDLTDRFRPCQDGPPVVVGPPGGVRMLWELDGDRGSAVYNQRRFPSTKDPPRGGELMAKGTGMRKEKKKPKKKK